MQSFVELEPGTSQIDVPFLVTGALRRAGDLTDPAIASESLSEWRLSAPNFILGCLCFRTERGLGFADLCLGSLCFSSEENYDSAGCSQIASGTLHGKRFVVPTFGTSGLRWDAALTLQVDIWHLCFGTERKCGLADLPFTLGVLRLFIGSRAAVCRSIPGTLEAIFSMSSTRPRLRHAHLSISSPQTCPSRISPLRLHSPSHSHYPQPVFPRPVCTEIRFERAMWDGSNDLGKEFGREI